MSKKSWQNPIYKGITNGGKSFIVEVTESIAPGLPHNSALINHLIPWLKDRGYKKILDFGAGALRHTLPLLDAGFEVTAVEYQEAFNKSIAKNNLEIAKTKGNFNELIWPKDFISSTEKYDIILLIYVLQTIPEKEDREQILNEIKRKLDNYGPKRVYYASRYGDSIDLKDEDRFKDGWIKKLKNPKQSFYTEWNAKETHDMFLKKKFQYAGTYGNGSQSYIYELENGL